MEEKVFPDPAVAAVLSEKFIEARIHTDHDEKGDVADSIIPSTFIDVIVNETASNATLFRKWV